MPVPVVMPKLGNSVESSIIVSWKKRKGDHVREGEVLCLVETDKATIEVESTATGVLVDILYAEGQDVPVMTAIALIGEAEPVGETAPPTPTSREITISPRARALAHDKGVEISGITGTGPGGRIIERDILAALKAAPRLTPLARAMVDKDGFIAPPQGTGPGGRVTAKDLQPPTTPAATMATATMATPSPIVTRENMATSTEEFETIPVRGVRRVIAERMLDSLRTTAQLTLNTTADARALQAYRQRLKTSAEPLGLRGVTINHLILFVAARTLLRYPELNAHFLGEHIRQYRAVHLGFAVDTPRGLVVPVVRHASGLSLKQLATAANNLSEACIAGTAAPDDLQGGTFTVTNLGSFGVENFTPILNPPQVAILGVGNINLKPVELDEKVEFVPHIGLSLTVNHQAVDGAPAARFLQALRQDLAALELLLAL